MIVFVIWRLSFEEIALHGDSTTVEFISKNNVFRIYFTLNSVSFFLETNFLEGDSTFTLFLYGKKTRSMRIRHLFHFLLWKIILNYRFCYLASFVRRNHLAWGLNHCGIYFLK